MEMVRLERVRKEFPNPGGTGKVVAVDDVSFSVSKGEFLTLLGPSGCGKTTTLRLVGGFETPTSGEIFIEGSPVTGLPPNKRPTSMVFQSYALFPHMTVFENVAYGLRVRRLPEREIRKRVLDMLELVGLSGLENRYPGHLSGGQQQRVALARALVVTPKVLLLDEPLSNLDAKLREQMRIELRRIQKEVGITAIYVTHDQLEAMSLSDRIVVMKDGRIMQVGTPEEIYRFPDNVFVANFIGRANLLDCTVTEVKGNQVKARLKAGGEVWATVREPSMWPVGADALLLSRPEGVRITSPQNAPLKGIIANRIYTGAAVTYIVKVNGEKVTVDVVNPTPGNMCNIGENVGIEFDPSTTTLVPKGEP